MSSIERKSYSILIKYNTFEDRFNYLSLTGMVGNVTFGGHRYLNQILYQSEEWKSARKEIILRDNGCDLGHEDFPITGSIYIHHINPITIDDILERRPCVFDLDNLVCTTFNTHNAIHYGSIKSLSRGFVERKRNDTCPWKR